MTGKQVQITSGSLARGTEVHHMQTPGMLLPRDLWSQKQTAPLWDMKTGQTVIISSQVLHCKVDNICCSSYEADSG